MRHLFSAYMFGLLGVTLLPCEAMAQVPTAAVATARPITGAGPAPSMGSVPQPADSVANGIAIGAVVGAATAIALTATAFARCDEGCEAPSPGGPYAFAAAVGGGGGAVIGWLIDRAHKARPAVSSRVWTVSPIVARTRKGVLITTAF